MAFPDEAINAQLDRLAAHPFYAGRLPRGVADAAEFEARVPLLAKEDFHAEMARPGYGAFAPQVAPVRINMTPTPGGLMAVMNSRGDLDRMVAAARAHLDLCGIGPGDRCLVAFGYHLFVAGLFYQTAMEAHGVGCIPHGPGEAARAAALARDHGVSVLAAAPSFALTLLEHGMPPPRVLFAGAEPFTGNADLYARVRAAMPETLLIDAYSLSEVLPVARTFPGGTGVHVFDELVHAEVVDPETGAALPEGERGELVLTHLHKELQPLVRYRTGDLSVLRRSEPVAGRQVHLPRVVFGRTDQMVKVKGVKLFPSEVRGLLSGADGLTGGYRLRVGRKPAGGDHLALIVEGQAGDAVLARIRDAFKRQTLIAPDEVRPVQALGDGPLVEDTRG